MTNYELSNQNDQYTTPNGWDIEEDTTDWSKTWWMLLIFILLFHDYVPDKKLTSDEWEQIKMEFEKFKEEWEAKMSEHYQRDDSDNHL